MSEDQNDNLIYVKPNHDTYIGYAVKWLKSQGCSVILAELVAATNTGETPDAIGWKGGKSYLVECKTSRPDFYRDKSKHFRRGNYHGNDVGIGNYRFYLTPPGIITDRSLPEGWGVYEVDGGKVRHAKGARFADRVQFSDPNASAEKALLLSALRRHQQGESDLQSLYRRLAQQLTPEPTSSEDNA